MNRSSNVFSGAEGFETRTVTSITRIAVFLSRRRELDRVREEAPALARELGQPSRSEEHTSELQSLRHLVCRLLLEKKKLDQRLQVELILVNADSAGDELVACRLVVIDEDRNN